MKNWTPEDIEILENMWGCRTIPTIAKRLGRTIEAVKLKAQRLGLGRHIDSGEEITFFQLVTALGVKGNYGYLMDSWPKYGCPIKFKKSIKRRFRVIKIDDFWIWAEKHKNLLDFSRFETNSLGKEPEWVSLKRRADIEAQSYKRKTPWTKAEDDYLIALLNEFKYGYKEIADKLCRTEGAIKRRMIDLKIKQRPVRADNHNPWSQEDIKKVKVLHYLGYIPEAISKRVNRSGSAVRGLLERLEKRNELIQIVEKSSEGDPGVSYKIALSPDLWPKASRFLRLMAITKEKSIELGVNPEIDLKMIRQAFTSVEGGILL